MVVAVVILIITIIMRRRPGEVSVPTPWGGPIKISPNDAGAILKDVLSDFSSQEREALLRFNNERSAPSLEELQAIDQKTLDGLVAKGLVLDPHPQVGTFRPERLRLARFGWHILRIYLKDTPKGRFWDL